jgi:hypothetical protein
MICACNGKIIQKKSKDLRVNHYPASTHAHRFPDCKHFDPVKVEEMAAAGYDVSRVCQKCSVILKPPKPRVSMSHLDAGNLAVVLYRNH